MEAQNQVVRKLEEKERLLQTNLATVEKELTLRQQAMEMHKRKAIESAQSAADLKLHLEKYHSQIKVRAFSGPVGGTQVPVPFTGTVPTEPIEIWYDAMR